MVYASTYIHTSRSLSQRVRGVLVLCVLNRLIEWLFEAAARTDFVYRCRV